MADDKAGLSIADIRPPTELPLNEADDLTKEESFKYATAVKKLEYASQSLDIEQRKEYARLIYDLIVWWLWAILGIVLLAGFGKVCGFFLLSDKVLITLIGGTTINVLGLFAIVANYIFRKPK